MTQIETWASTRGERELRSEDLGERIMHHLYVLDQVAYVRFVSVYRSFESIEEFEHLLREMQKAERVNIEGQRTLFPELARREPAEPPARREVERRRPRKRRRKAARESEDSTKHSAGAEQGVEAGASASGGE